MRQPLHALRLDRYDYENPQDATYQDATYDERLMPMVAFVNEYLSDGTRTCAQRRDAMRAASDFCFNYPKHFQRSFLRHLEGPSGQSKNESEVRLDVEAFADTLQRRGGECVFLLKDAFICMEAYQSRSQHGFGIMVNRSLLCAQECDYFDLLSITYSSLLEACDYGSFRSAHAKRLRKLIGQRPRLEKAAREICLYVSRRCSSGFVTFVDTGSQYTFSLFCQESLALFGNPRLYTDIYSYSAYPWLLDVFKNRFFTEDSRTVMKLEAIATERFSAKLNERARGALTGFAVGDALGFPVAGVEANDVPAFISSNRVESYVASPRHPYFGDLRSGQYTSNTILMKIMARHLLRNAGFERDLFVRSLTGFARLVLAAPNSWRWIGPTTMAALERMVCPSHRSFPILPTSSCAASYRSVPLAIFFRPFTSLLPSEFEVVVSNAARVTHDSGISAAGALYVAELLGDLISGVIPRTAALAAAQTMSEKKEAAPLFERILLAIRMSRSETIENARKVFDTGSPIDQTLPLALFCFLHDEDCFSQVIINGANSFRVDVGEERAKLARMSPRDAMQAARGGNTDGIAALAGAFAGANLGINALPEHWKTVEGADELECIASALALQITNLELNGRLGQIFRRQR